MSAQGEPSRCRNDNVVYVLPVSSSFSHSGSRGGPARDVVVVALRGRGSRLAGTPARGNATAPQQRPSRRRHSRRAGSQRCRRRQLFACFIQVMDMDQLHPKARRPRRALYPRCEVCALRARRTPWPPRMPCAQESRQVPPKVAPAAALLTSLTARAGWVAPVTGMGQWGVGAKTRPQTPPPPRLGRRQRRGRRQAVGCVGFVCD